MPVLLYGIETISVNAKIRNSLENAFCTVFAKIFSTFDRNVLLNCQFYCGILPLSYTIDLRIIEFLKSLSTSSNDCIQFHLERSGKLASNILFKKYNIPPMSLASSCLIKKIMWTMFEKSIVVLPT